ncbi:ATP-binding protein [Thalassotalea euphylliae]|uniref:histidine kinase n=1 Tax=Thalassotalea euphylliae TaxID=1655234 RepID=A0A3E0UCH2_9GAMM|nr:ATP-binding protein [Thalassotalea euphylliae]REL34540.1 hypothetical protein DXX92_03755 [Thalassotalea euphylliae]
MKNLFIRLYLFLILTLVGLGWSIDLLYNATLNKAVVAERQLTSDLELHKGTFFLLETELKRQPAPTREQHLTAITTSFGYPVSLLHLAELTSIAERVETPLSQAQLDYLSLGGIVTLYDDIAGESWFFKTLTPTQANPRISAEAIKFAPAEPANIIALGPILTESAEQTDAVYTLIFFIGLALVVFIWVWPISRGLMSLTKAATIFGRGDFSVRASTKVAKPLEQLVLRFNSMAARIQRLIKSHQELSHAVSHELRTPIARIRFAMEIIRDEDDKAMVNQYIDTMDKSIEELDALVDELLVYARFDREEPQLELKSINLVNLAYDVCHRSALTEPELTFQINGINYQDANELSEVTCFADKEAMNRVVDNLVRNAVRYAKTTINIAISNDGQQASKSGSPEGSLHVQKPAAPQVKLAVQDDGPGIPEPDRQSLFEPFVRLEDTRDHKSGGIGLGLAIVKRYVELHKGRVDVDQAPLGGASFILTWPKQ